VTVAADLVASGKLTLAVLMSASLSPVGEGGATVALARRSVPQTWPTVPPVARYNPVGAVMCPSGCLYHSPGPPDWSPRRSVTIPDCTRPPGGVRACGGAIAARLSPPCPGGPVGRGRGRIARRSGRKAPPPRRRSPGKTWGGCGRNRTNKPALRANAPCPSCKCGGCGRMTPRAAGRLRPHGRPI